MEHLWKQNLRQIEPYVPGEQSSDPDRIKLNANENPYPPAPGVEAVLRSYDPAALCLYPDANARLLKASIARHYGVAPEQVFVGNGSDDVLALAFQSFFNSDKPIAFPDITYSFYPVWCRLFHIPFVTYPLTADFRIDPADYAAPNGGVVLPNPNAPTSIGEDLPFVQALLEGNRDAVVIIDEAYADFGGVSAVPLLAAATPRAVWLEADPDSLTAAGILAGEDVAKHLEGCTAALLLAVTLGPGVDAQIRRAGVGDIAAGRTGCGGR